MNKGTLTILSDTSIVLGCSQSDGLIYSPAQEARFAEQALNWLQNGGVLMLPFPVEVIDMRQRSNEVTIEQVTDIANASKADILRIMNEVLSP